MRRAFTWLLTGIPLVIFSCGESKEKPCIGADCVTACPDGPSCHLECHPSATECSGECVDTYEDREHCGACGNQCAEEEFCVGGRCESECGGRVPDQCGDRCVDRRSHSDHCGGCDVRCADGQFCVAGACASSCGALAPTPCGRTCVDLQNDSRNCGACGQACQDGQRCVDGACGSDCAGERPHPCADRCVDLQADPLACGDCTRHCEPTEVCAGGECASSCEASGLSECLGECVDLQRDPRACGQCGKRCRTGSVCSQGQCGASCTGPGEIQCADRCVLSGHDPKHCGGCDQACEFGALCIDGSCEAMGTAGGPAAAGASHGGESQGGASLGGAGSGGAGGVGVAGAPEGGAAGDGGASTGSVCGAGMRPVGQYAEQCGKVNVHTDGEGSWVSDVDCASTCGQDSIPYCRKFWPTATLAFPVTPDETKVFQDPGCTAGASDVGSDQFVCCAACPRRWSGEAAEPNGVVMGEAELGVPGQIDGALDLPSAGSYLEAADSDALEAGTWDLSLAFWVQTTATGGTILYKRMISPELRGYVVFIEWGKVGVQLADGDWTNFVSEAYIDDGTWHHVAVTLDRDQPDGLKVYLDGTLNSTFDPTGRSGDLSNSEPLSWGAASLGASGMVGMLDEMSLYQRALTPDEVELLAQGQSVDVVGCD